MAVYGNFKGTTQPGFTVGKPGAASIYGNNSSEPSSPTSGDIWMDSANTALKIYDGSEWTQGTFVGTLEGFVELTVEAGENLTKGDVVYVSGTSGNTPQVRKAQSNSTSTMPAIGIMHENVNTGNTGHVVVQGNLTGINTSTFTEGDVLYVSSTVAGAFQNTAPSGESNRIQNIGKITNAATGGSILVTGAGRFNATNALNDGNIFIGDASNNAVTAPLDTSVSDLGYLKNVVEDTTPQLGGALDGQGFDITGAGNIAGTSLAVTGQFTLPTADGTSGQTLLTDGSGGVTWNTPSSAVVGGYVYTQSPAATTWTVTHNLGQQYLNVEVVNSNGESLAGTMNYPVIDFVSSNQLTATFATATSGYLVASAGTGPTGFTGSIGFTGSQGTSGTIATLQQVTDNGSTTNNDVTMAGIEYGSLTDGVITVTNFQSTLSDTDTAVPTSGAVVDYTAIQLNALSLDVATNSGSANINIATQVFSLQGGQNITISGVDQTATVALDSALSGITSITANGAISTTGGVTGSSLTDGTATLTSGALTGATDITATGTITGGTLTDGTLSATGGAITGATSFTATGTITAGTFTDGTMTITSGNLTGAVSGTFTGTVTAGTLTDGSATITNGNVTGSNGTFTNKVQGGTVTDGTATLIGGEINTSGNIVAVQNITGGAIIRSGGTSSQFLKADGSVDSNAYTTNGGTVTQVNTSGSVNGITLTGGPITTSGTVTLGGTLADVTLDQLLAANVITSGESFSDVDTAVLTAAATDDRILSYGYTTNTGTVTNVSTAGSVNGITLTGGDITTTGTVTLGGTLSGITLSQLDGAAVITSGESFQDIDTAVLTAAATDDRILSYGYTTNVGDITGVTAGNGLTGGGASGDVTLNVGAGTGVTVAADTVSIGQDVATSASVTFGSVQTTTLTTGSNATAGTVTGDWTLTAGSTWEATYADLAEKYTTDGPYEAGTVMKFGGDAELTQSDTHNDTKVAGVISTAPAFTMNGGIDGSYLALAGRVPVKVVGDVQPGDMLVASATPGHAQTNNKPEVGTVIGKAITGSVDGVCEALVILM